ncbi:hypothetical protein ASD25_04715 [Brevundimonas sp. Root1423]|nr:hypothetical protein ASD25_04715 [Brevundimonas sp. Root1423]
MFKTSQARPVLAQAEDVRVPARVRRVGLIVAALTVVCASAAGAPAWAAQQDQAQEHPVVKAYPGAEVEVFERKEFDVAKIVTGLRGLEGTLENAEGAISHYVYVHADGTSPIQVVRNFGRALKDAGFIEVLSGPDIERDGGRHDYFGAYRLDSNGQPAIHVNVAADVNGEITRSDVLIIDVEGMEQVYAVNADALYAGLEATGRVTLDGVQFETGRATLRPESFAALTEARNLLIARPELKLGVEGHTDNVGAPATNQSLSLQRAEAVKAWLVENGVDASRLTAAGFGDGRPQASNADDAGRARNRRVELVRQ